MTSIISVLLLCNTLLMPFNFCWLLKTKERRREFFFLFFFFKFPPTCYEPGWPLESFRWDSPRALPRCAGLSVLLGDTRAADGVERTGRDNPTYIFPTSPPWTLAANFFFLLSPCPSSRLYSGHSARKEQGDPRVSPLRNSQPWFSFKSPPCLCTASAATTTTGSNGSGSSSSSAASSCCGREYACARH